MTARRTGVDFMELFGVLKRRLHSLSTELYAGAGIPRAQARFVWEIGKHGRLSQAELARLTDSDPALTGRTVQALLDAGLVRRQRSDEDRREYVVELTAAGRRRRERAEKARDEVAARIAARLDERDFADFQRIVDKIVGAE